MNFTKVAAKYNTDGFLGKPVLMIFLKIVDRIAFLQVYAKGTPYPGREFSSS